MWASTIVIETADDRLIVETVDSSATEPEALERRDVFLRREAARLVAATALQRDENARHNPRLKPRTKARMTTPWRPDLGADQRDVLFETLDLPDGPGGLMGLAFDAHAEWPCPLEVPHPDLMPPVETFALIDCALNMTMPDALEGSGLDHVTLLSGGTARTLAEVTPVLVRLVQDHPLTRALLNAAEAPVGHWGLQSALILRSRLGLHGLRRSLRSFLRVEGAEGGRPLFFRFYAPSVWRSVVPEMDPAARLKMMAGIDLVIGPGDRTGSTALLTHRGQI